MKPWVVAVVTALLALVTHVPASATQAYGDGWTTEFTGNPKKPAIRSCSVSDGWTYATTAGGGKFGVEDLRVIAGKQDIDNTFVASKFLRVAKATKPKAYRANLVTACRYRVVKGVPRIVLTLRSGAVWAMVRPRVGDYYVRAGS